VREPGAAPGSHSTPASPPRRAGEPPASPPAGEPLAVPAAGEPLAVPPRPAGEPAAPARPDVAGARRVVVKVGSSSLTTAQGGIDESRIAALAQVLAERAKTGTQLVLVSSGAIAAGLAPLRLARRPRDLATQQAAASVGQGLLIASYTAAFGRHGVQVGQVLLTADDLIRRAHYRNAQRTLRRLLDLGVVAVVNENDTVATDEIRFGDNDRLAALVAHVIGAGALVLLSDVDGLYDADPSHPGARRIERVAVRADLAGAVLGPPGRSRPVGTGGMATKVDAALIAGEAGIPAVVTGASQAAAALAGAPVGTYFAAQPRRLATRQLWLAHAAAARGRLLLDEGAVRAVVAGRASLLPAGVTGVEGAFEAGDPVDLCGPGGEVVARGLAGYGAAEIPALMGRSTRWLAARRGPEYQRELVHADDLVVLVPARALVAQLERERAKHAASMRERLARLAADVAALPVAGHRPPELGIVIARPLTRAGLKGTLLSENFEVATLKLCLHSWASRSGE
jgi:glutamate 5-kinase